MISQTVEGFLSAITDKLWLAYGEIGAKFNTFLHILELTIAFFSVISLGGAIFVSYLIYQKRKSEIITVQNLSVLNPPQSKSQNIAGNNSSSSKRTNKRNIDLHKLTHDQRLDFQASLEVLGISGRTSATQIKRAYRKLAKQYHPDRRVHQPPDELADLKFILITRAYERTEALIRLANSH